jgi:hypothetical protein
MCVRVYIAVKHGGCTLISGAALSLVDTATVTDLASMSITEAGERTTRSAERVLQPKTDLHAVMSTYD